MQWLSIPLESCLGINALFAESSFSLLDPSSTVSVHAGSCNKIPKPGCFKSSCVPGMRGEFQHYLDCIDVLLALQLPVCFSKQLSDGIEDEEVGI